MTSAWSGEVSVEPVAPWDAHTLHAYFNACPESPDGRRLLVFRSTRAEAERGDICVIDREDGGIRSLVEDVAVEDAHRQACQQWADGGRWVVFHAMRDGRAIVCRANARTGQADEIAGERQVGFSPAAGRLVPLHGQHWSPGEHRDLELLDVPSGEVRAALTLEDVVGEGGSWARRMLSARPRSIYFPVLSPDESRVLFKLSAPRIGRLRHPRASRREGLLVYDLERPEEIYRRDAWGHPAWFSDSRRIINTPNTIIDVDVGEEHTLGALPSWRGSHPSMSPDGRMMVADIISRTADGSERWAIVVADVETERWRTLHLGDLPRAGTRSWRPVHPHPVFSHDGRRIYFNVNRDDWTVLHVARVTGNED
ncbi:MAG: hypothetical protein GF393_00125 [Armatimonadia bacterium]|nr:hypothetical protein [Armatimonadia bacterium]